MSAGWVQRNLLVLLVTVTVGLKCHGKELLAKQASGIPAHLCGHAENPWPGWVQESRTLGVGSCVLGDVLGWGRHAVAAPSLSSAVVTPGSCLKSQESNRILDTKRVLRSLPTKTFL